MAEPYIGEIRMFAGNFAPRNWAFCEGQTLNIADNDALYSLLGTTYGGNGQTTFGLPDMRGRLPINQGHGPGLTSRILGQKGGVEYVTLTVDQMPEHQHNPQASTVDANQSQPIGTVLANTATNLYTEAEDGFPSAVDMNSSMLVQQGGNQKHLNIQPVLGLNFIISLQGIYPPRS